MMASRTYSNAVVYTLFTSTGVAVVLPGALLPLFLSRFLLHDAQGGALLFASFIGSALGALLARGTLPYSIARGAALSAVGAVCLANAASLLSLFGSIFLFGVGLGITMTSSSLLQARNYAASRSAELSRMNLLWSMGATSGPWLALHGAHRWTLHREMIVISGCFLLMSLLAVFCRDRGKQEANAIQSSRFSRTTILLLLVSILLSTGIEAAVGGWLTTYAERLRATLTFTVAAGTCFWAGILASRFSQSFPRIAATSKRLLLLLGPLLMILGTILLLISRAGSVEVGALLLGLGIGPMYPLLLAHALSSGERSNIAFVLAGCGASLLPLLTGAVSSSFGGLKWGLGVPLLASGVMLLSNLTIRNDLPQCPPGSDALTTSS